MYLNIKISKAYPERAIEYGISKNILDEPVRRNLITSKSPAQEMRDTAARYGKWQGQKDRKSFSIVVSPNPSDNPTREEVMQVTKAVLDHFFPSIQGVIVLHYDKGKDVQKTHPILHSHFFGSIIDPMTGKNIHLSDTDVRRIRAWADDYAARQFGWKPFRRGTNRGRTYKREMKQQIANRGKSGWLDKLNHNINDAYEESKSFEEFCSLLGNKGITVLQDDETKELKFEVAVKDKRYQVNARTIGEQYTWNNLKQKFAIEDSRRHTTYGRSERNQETQIKKEMGTSSGTTPGAGRIRAGESGRTGHSFQRRIDYACILCTKDKDICRKCSEYEHRERDFGHGSRSR